MKVFGSSMLLLPESLDINTPNVSNDDVNAKCTYHKWMVAPHFLLQFNGLLSLRWYSIRKAE